MWSLLDYMELKSLWAATPPPTEIKLDKHIFQPHYPRHPLESSQGPMS